MAFIILFLTKVLKIIYVWKTREPVTFDYFNILHIRLLLRQRKLLKGRLQINTQILKIWSIWKTLMLVYFRLKTINNIIILEGIITCEV